MRGRSRSAVGPGRGRGASPAGAFAWRGWSFDWDAVPGEHELACRATDSAGNTQPLEQPWNYQGMANNLVQRVPVTIR